MSKAVPLHGFGGGGASLNFKVVGGTVRPANGSENLIWVNTSSAISSYAFSAEEPTQPVEGMAWILIDTESETPFNALKKNNLTVYPGTVKQYIDGAWVRMDASIYQNGAWMEFSASFDGVLFNNGDQCTDITGGWINVNEGENISLSQGASANNQGTITEKAYTSRKIDLTDWNSLKANLTACSGYVNLIVSPLDNAAGGFDSFTAYKQVKNVTGEIELDISAIEGEYYVAMCAGPNQASFTCNMVWLA